MDIDTIRETIDRDELRKATGNAFALKLVKLYDEVAALQELVPEGEYSQTDVDKLRMINRQTEAAIKEEFAKTVTIAKKLGVEIPSNQREEVNFTKMMGKLEDKLQRLRQEAEALVSKPAELQSQRKRLASLQALKPNYEKKIAALGAEHQNAQKLLARLRPFVEKVEALEVRMDEQMDVIWDGVKEDAFDRDYPRR